MTIKANKQQREGGVYVLPYGEDDDDDGCVLFTTTCIIVMSFQFNNTSFNDFFTVVGAGIRSSTRVVTTVVVGCNCSRIRVTTK